MSGQVTTKPTILQSLSERLAASVSPQDLLRARLHVLDWLGCAAHGLATESGVKLAQFAASAAVVGPAKALGHAARMDISSVLAVNAGAGNIGEMDDIHRTSILHPGPIVIPAAIAAADWRAARGEATTGQDLLTAITRGYEAAIRIGRALGPTHYRYFHNTSTAGTFGAAAAAAAVLRLTVTETAWAMGHAGSRTGGLWQMRHEPTQTKSLHNVWAAQLGFAAALAARAGLAGPTTLLEGAQGLFSATAPGANPFDVLAELDGPWAMHDVSFKPWPACRHAHPAIDAALVLQGRVAASAIEKVTVHTYQSAVDFCDKPQPKSTLEAKFSLQHCVAVALTRGRPDLADFGADARLDAGLAGLRARVMVVADAPLTARFPQHYGARILVRATGGESYEVAALDALGDPENPLAESALIDKARMLLAAGGLADSGALIDATFSLVDAPDLQAWQGRWL